MEEVISLRRGRRDSRTLIGGVTRARHVGSPFDGRHGYSGIRGEIDVTIRFLQRRTAGRARNILRDEDAT